MADFQFVPGTFHSFRSIAKIHLGKLARDLQENQVVQFDGQTLKLDGIDHSYYELRAGVKAGWLVPQSDNISTYTPKSSDTKIRAAQDKGKATKSAPITVSDDERDVGSARPKRALIRADQSEDGTVVPTSFSRELKNQDEEERSLGPSTAASRASSGAVKPFVAKVATEMSSDSSGNEDARSVGRISSPAKQKTVIRDASEAAMAAQKLDNTPSPRAILNSPKGTEIFSAEAEKVETILDVLNPEDQAQIIRQQRKAQLVSTEKTRLGDTKVLAEAIVVPSVSDADSWDMSGHWLSRVKLAKEKYGDNPEALAKIYAVEIPSVVARIQKDLSGQPPLKIKTPTSIEGVILAGDDIDLGDGLKWDMKIHWLSRVKIAKEKYGNNPEILSKILAVEAPSVVSYIEKALKANPVA